MQSAEAPPPPNHARRNTIPRTRVALRWAQHAPFPLPAAPRTTTGAACPLPMPGPPRRGEGTWHGVGVRADYHGTERRATRFASHRPIKGGATGYGRMTRRRVVRGRRAERYTGDSDSRFACRTMWPVREDRGKSGALVLCFQTCCEREMARVLCDMAESTVVLAEGQSIKTQDANSSGYTETVNDLTALSIFGRAHKKAS